MAFSFELYTSLKAKGLCALEREADGSITAVIAQFDGISGESLPAIRQTVDTNSLDIFITQYQGKVDSLTNLKTDLANVSLRVLPTKRSV